VNETPEQVAARTAAWIKSERHQLEYGCKHCVWVQREIVLGDFHEPITPVVRLTNDDDGFYVQTFHTASELDEFIGVLQAARTEAFGQGHRRAELATLK
jgi:hypothetical protein